MVTGFIMRGAMFLFITRAASWGEIRWLILGTSVYGLILLAASMVHGDKFHWRQPLAILWFILYLEEPIWMLTLVPDSRAAVAASGVLALPGAPINTFLQAVLWLEAAVLIVVGLSMLLQLRTTTFWPWNPDVVSAVVISGFPIGWSLWASALARAPSWAEASVGVLINIFWLLMVFVSLLIFRRLFDFSNRVTRVLAFTNLLFLVLLIAGYLMHT